MYDLKALEALRENVAIEKLKFCSHKDFKPFTGKMAVRAFAAYHGSTDTAIALVEAVLPNWSFLMGRVHGDECGAVVYEDPEYDLTEGDYVTSTTISRALLLATLDALIAQAKEGK